MKAEQIRRCPECKRTYVGAESFRQHKINGLGCRSVEGLLANRYVETPKGWKQNAIAQL